MKRLYLPEYGSLRLLLEGHSQGTNLNAQARRGSYWHNTVKVTTRHGKGSGILITRDGFLVTNDHVLNTSRDGNEVSFFGQDHQQYHLGIERVICRSLVHDLSLVKVTLSSAQVPNEVVFSAIEPNRRHQRVRTYGFKEEVPEELEGETYLTQNDDTQLFSDKLADIYGDTLRSLVRPNDLDEKERRKRESTFYTTCPAIHGWSGGPVVDEFTGNLLGITKWSIETDKAERILRKAPEQIHGFTYIGRVHDMIRKYLDREAT